VKPRIHSSVSASLSSDRPNLSRNPLHFIDDGLRDGDFDFPVNRHLE
jgi:hypothetical protein